MKLNRLRLERYFSKYELSTPYLLCFSGCESMELGALLALEPGANEQFSSLWLGYAESLGHTDFRQTES